MTQMSFHRKLLEAYVSQYKNYYSNGVPYVLERMRYFLNIQIKISQTKQANIQ